MAELDKLDTRIRNISLVMIFIAIILLIIWIVFQRNSHDNTSPLLMSLGLALLFPGILILTRIQYVIWMKKRY